MELAKRWAVDLEVVKHAAQRAGQALRVLMQVDKEELRARNAAHLEGLAADAHAAGEFRAAVSARDSIAKLLGLNAPEKHEHRVSAEQFSAMPPAEQRAKLLEARAAIDERLRALDELEGVVPALHE